MPWNLRVVALGATVQIEGDELPESQRDAVTNAWRDAAAFSEAEADVVVHAAAGMDDAHLLQDLSQQVTLAAIDARRGELWMLHAAGIATEDGRVIAFVGPSGRGKTTASRALGRVFGYVSDETVAIDADGRVWPYRKPLSVIVDVSVPKVQISPTDAGMQPLPDVPLSLAAVVLLERRADGPDAPVIEDVDLGDALSDLVEQTSYLPALQAPLQLIAGHLAATGGVRRVIYREAATLAGVVGALVESAGEGVVFPGAETAPRDETPVAPASGPLYFRTATADSLALRDPDRIALLQVDDAGAGTVSLLAGVAPALWRRATGAPLEGLVDAAVVAYGTPADQDAAEVVATAASELVNAGVLEHREAHWSIVNTVPWVDSEDRVVLLAPGEGLARAFDTSGTIIWRTLYERGPSALDDLVESVAESAGVAAEEVAPTLPPFLDELLAIGVVRRG